MSPQQSRKTQTARRWLALFLGAALLLFACQIGTPAATETPAEAPAQTDPTAPPEQPATDDPEPTPIPPTERPPEEPTPTEAAAPAYQFEYEHAPCAFTLPPDINVDCGYLTVPEDRSQPEAGSIRLHVALFHSASNSPAPDPIVYLEGGPGGNPLEAIYLVYSDRFEALTENRDLIILDQRGTGLSEPALDCREVVELTYDILDQDLSSEEAVALAAEALHECSVRLAAEGVNLAAYNSAENAADLHDLRLALGYESWNLFGISYGTRLAQTIMRDHPAGLRSVILDSSYPLEVSLNASTPANADRAFNTLFAGCAANAECNATYPELKTVFYTLVEQLNETPVMLSVTHPLSGETYDMLLNGDGLMAFFFQSLYSSELIPLLPQILYDAQSGNYDRLALFEGSFLLNVEFISQGMYYSVQCHEEVSFSEPGDFEAPLEDYPHLAPLFADNESIFTICADWGAGEAPPIENQPISSDVPTLILAGEYDPITPPAWGAQIDDHLANSYYFEFPGLGHGTAISDDCPRGIAQAFWNDPTTAPNAGCIGSMSGPDFRVGEEAITLVPFSESTMGIQGVVPEEWTEIAPGVYGSLDTAIAQLAVPGMGADLLLDTMLTQLGVEETLESTGTREANGFTWTLYTTEAQGMPVDLAIAEDSANAYIVLLQSSERDHDFYYESVFLPAIDALTPLDN